ncbi:MAG: helix-turn-helix domain-containing protein [bacterium]
MNNISQILKNLGLNSKETKIYLALLELGTGTVQQVAREAKIKRTNVYDHLGDMKAMGLLSEIKHDKKTLLIPENPQILKQKACENLENINHAMPELLGIFNTPGSKPTIKFYEGKQGLKQAFERILQEVDSGIYAITDAEQMMATMDEKYMWNWAVRRANKDITYQAIIKEGKKGKMAKKLDKKQKRETKLVKDVKFSTEILIFDNKVAMMSYKKPYSATIIEDIAVADTMRAMWKGWWNSLK